MSEEHAVEVGHHAVVLVADIAASGLTEKQASEQAAKMHQKLDEIVYLFDGKVTDPLAPLLIAEMPDADRAIQAARRAREELETFNSRKTKADSILARVVIHSGDVKSKDLSLAGRTVELALSVLDALLPLQAAVSRSVLEEAGLPGSGVPLLKLGDAEFFEVPAEGPVEEAESETAAIPDRVKKTAPTIDTRPLPTARRWLIPAIAAVVVFAAIGGWLFLRGSGVPEQQAPTAEAPRPAAPVIGADTLSVEPFPLEGLDERTVSRISTTRRALIELLRPMEKIEIVTGLGEAAARMGAHSGPAPSVVPPAGESDSGSSEGRPRVGLTPFLLVGSRAIDGEWVDVTDEGIASRTLARWVTRQLAPDARPPGSNDDEAMVRFARAVALVVERGAAGNADAIGEIRAAIEKDPQFLAAHAFAVSLFDAGNDAQSAHESLRRAHEIVPEHPGFARELARRDVASGNVASGLSLYATLLRAIPGDQESLRVLGLYALGVNDANRFRAVLGKLASVPASDLPLHEPDLVNITGDINRAVQLYYEIEANVPNNVSLSFKIGRLATLRRSSEIANIELEKLRSANAGFQLHMLRAYVAAQEDRLDDMDDSLRLARRTAGPGDAINTWTAEVYAIAGRANDVLPSLEAAVATGEPTLHLITTDPLFKFLESDARFTTLLETIEDKKGEIARVLGTVSI